MTELNQTNQLNDDMRSLSALSYGASTFAKLSSQKVDFTKLKIDAGYKRMTADAIELQALENANILREQFNQGVGSLIASGANRGIAVGSGVIQENIEKSAQALGKDIQKESEKAKLKAGTLRKEAKLEEDLAKPNFWDTASTVLGGAYNIASLYYGGK